MSEQDVPSPEIKARSGPSLVWLIPLVVLAVGAWLIYDTLSKRGPDITIAFRTADGIEAGKTKLRYKNIEIGVVESVRFSDDFSHVLLKAQMELGADTFLRRGTRFWVVRPRLSARGVSGLSTLVSGAYIEVEPGAGADQRHFEGLESPPVVRADEAGRRVTLISDRLGSLGAGS
ncbi:MAG: MlaD family protein, partial [Gammaproteobacteria bacterium]